MYLLLLVGIYCTHWSNVNQHTMREELLVLAFNVKWMSTVWRGKLVVNATWRSTFTYPKVPWFGETILDAHKWLGQPRTSQNVMRVYTLRVYTIYVYMAFDDLIAYWHWWSSVQRVWLLDLWSNAFSWDLFSCIYLAVYICAYIGEGGVSQRWTLTCLISCGHV